MTSRTAIGVFETRERAREAVSALRAAGFSDSQLGMISRDRSAAATGETSGLPDDPTHSRWEEGTGIGAAAGATTGVGLGLAVAAGLIPAIGPVIAGGTLMALIASAGAGATVGTVLGGLIGLGVPEDDAQYYENEFHTGRTLVTVDAGDRYAEAASILRQYGASDRAGAAAGGVSTTPGTAGY
jgi:hypothetical protein